MKANQTRDLKTAIVNLIRGEQGIWVGIESFSRFYHKLSLFSFKNKIGNNEIQEMRDPSGRHNPGYLDLPVAFLAFGVAQGTSKVSNQPFHYSGVGVCNGYASGEVNPGSVDLFGLSDASGLPNNAFIGHGYGAFTIQNTSQISKLSNRIFHLWTVCHNWMIKIHRERLNPENPKGYAIV